jgi:hypothetical protein
VAHHVGARLSRGAATAPRIGDQRDCASRPCSRKASSVALSVNA